jgi:hypothetical protein
MLWKLLLAALLAVPFMGGGAAYASTGSADSAESADSVESTQSADSTQSAESASAAQPARAPKAARGTDLTAARCCHITIPSNYVYNPDGPNKSLHDYCTSSPDQFPAPGDNADFRGSCARHDLCYQYHQRSQLGCDNQFGSHLQQECTYQYGSLDPRRGACQNTASVYYAAVVAHTLWP